MEFLILLSELCYAYVNLCEEEANSNTDVAES